MKFMFGLGKFLVTGVFSQRNFDDKKMKSMVFRSIQKREVELTHFI
jgi:hypothetical protein